MVGRDLIVMGQYYQTWGLTMIIVLERMTVNNITMDNSLYEICLYSVVYSMMMIG